MLPASGKLKSNHHEPSYLAFDTGPGNVFIDAAMRILTNGQLHFDRDGALGAKGESLINETIVNAYLDEEPYFHMSPPKTTGRELFSDVVAQSLVDRMTALEMSPEAIIATITRITAESIARAYETFVHPLLEDGAVIDEIYICGGGALNPNILKHLRSRFPRTRVGTLDESPIKLDPSAKEAVLFALLGFLCVCGRRVPIALDAETADPAVLGVVTPGDNYRKIMRAVAGEEDFDTKGVLGRILIVEPKK